MGELCLLCGYFAKALLCGAGDAIVSISAMIKRKKKEETTNKTD